MKRLVNWLSVLAILAPASALATPLPAGEASMKAAKLAAPKPPETPDDILRVAAYFQQRRMTLFDQNGDGALSPDEWLEYHFAYTATYNVKGDGRILLSEFAQSINGPVAHPLPSLRPRKEIERLFRQRDRGNKGYLVIEDLRDDATGWFRLNDLNRDNRVTEAEIYEVATRNRRH